ncbi:MAG: GerMN domain-containing protein [Pelovirga sp.]
MKNLLIGLAAVLGIGILLGYGIGWFFQHGEKETAQLPVIVEEALPPRAVILYFAEPDGRYLQRVEQTIPGCEEDSGCILGLLQQLIAGPTGEGIPVLPAATRILGVEVENDLVRINFSHHLSDLHPGGSLSELLTIHSLIISLSESFPYLRQLQILIESEVRQTLKGHVRIDRPVTADYALTQPPLSGREEASQTRPAAEGLSIEDIIQQSGEQRN